jgi:L-lactate dehydrogenase complex protein LldF
MSRSFLGWPAFPEAAAREVGNRQLRENVRRATHTIRGKRAVLAAERPDWEQLRDSAAAIKDRVLADLEHYLLQVEEKVTAAGGTVHWARDAAEANRIVTDLVKATGEREIVKVKSMLTEEIGLDAALEAAGISARETDLAATIVQLGDDLPSHVVVPALHRNRSEIREIFAREMGRHGRPPPKGSPTTPPNSPKRPGCTCGRSSSAPGSPSPAPTSWSPRPAPWSSSSPRATAGCASPSPTP